jgi:glycosyltransferase involved in cell wall biosynthesis
MKILLVSHTVDPTTGGWGRYTYDLKYALEREGHTVYTLPEFSGASLENPVHFLRAPLGYVSALRLLRKALAAYDPDIVHITVEPYLLLLPYLPSTKAKFLLTVHGTYAYLPLQVAAWWRAIARSIYICAVRHLAGSIAVSAYTKSVLLREAANDRVSLREDAITVIHNGIAVDQYQYTERILGKVKRILTVAPVKLRKGIREAVRALAVYREKYGADFEYHIVGAYEAKSSYMMALREDVRALKLESHVKFLGRVSEEVLREEYAAADLFLMLPIMSRDHAFEGFGLVYLEASACGVPTIGSSIGGSAEAIKDNMSGYLVDAYDSTSVAESLHSALSGQKLSRSVARAWAEQHDIRVSVRNILELYKSVLSTQKK